MYLLNPIKIYFIVVPIIGLALVLVNAILATQDNYNEKTGPFECGFTSFSQSRTPFSVAFILVAILFLPFDLEISSILPYVLSSYNIGVYGLLMLVLFLLILVVGFTYEINTGALHINRINEHKVKSLKKEFYKS